MKKIIVCLLLIITAYTAYATTPEQARALMREGVKAYEQQEYSKAMSLLQQASLVGEMKASRYIGLMWLNGEGVEQSPTKALESFRLAAQRGDITAQYWLGYCYENGIGTTQDYASALGWYLISAQRGDKIAAPAMQALANMYQQGLGVQADTAQAQYWQNKAELAPSLQH